MLHTLILAAVLNGTVIFRQQSGGDVAAVGVPVGGALVELLQDRTTIATATSATDGTFTIPDLAPGTYSIYISSNHTPTSGTIVVHDIDPNLGVDAPRTFFVFDPPCGAMFGRVHDQVTGIGVPRGEVDFWGSSATDLNGDYFLSYLCYPAPGYKLSGTTGIGAAARGYKKNFHLIRAEAVTTGLEGKVLDFELQPLPGPPERPLPRHERK